MADNCERRTPLCSNPFQLLVPSGFRDTAIGREYPHLGALRISGVDVNE
jgi:hypothetical protein